MSSFKELSEELQARELRYKSLFESAPDGILILDAVSQKIIEANPSMFKLLECSSGEILGKKLWEIGLFKNEEESRSAIRELETSGWLHCEELPLKTKTGKLLIIELIGNLFFEEKRKFVQCNIRNITERKRVEREREEKARQTAFLAQVASKAARLGGWTIELPERKLTWSDENCAIHEVPPGYKPTLEEGIGYFPPEYQEQVTKYVEACAKDGTPYEFEVPKYTAKGRLIWVRSIGEAVRDADDNIIRLQGAFQDITARKQAEAEREMLIKELKEAFAEVKTLREFLPICSYCKKVRDDQDYWLQIENYISKHTDTKFSHGICPDCYELEVIPKLEKLKRKLASDS